MPPFSEKGIPGGGGIRSRRSLFIYSTSSLTRCLYGAITYSSPQMRLPSPKTKGAQQHSGKVEVSPKLRHSLQHSAGNNGRATCCPSKRSPLLK
ncbi:hypothetical protein CDAR_558161 [Caerostris darwini]|uniref:Uncharacterized protein n=1 Tax=Caerostris darwini TaxID=1538125 RepID=A0AAV4R9J4_9ARAC|nr:hypothetical protein CDAR_558161 [Caerostris darwini]